MKTSGLEMLTETTGTIKGEVEVKNFISMCHTKFDKVIIRESPLHIENYLQYTLLTKNEIILYI